MTVLVGYVVTREGQAALTAAGKEAELRGSPLIVVRAGSGRTDDLGAEDAFAAKVEDLRGQLGADRVEIRDVEESVGIGEDLVKTAEEMDAKLIVIGLRRRSPVGKLILGSNAQRTLLDAPCPVLAVKAE